MAGVGAALLSILIFASYPVATRAGLAASVDPADLILMRFGIGAAFFIPYLVLRRRDLTAMAWRTGLPLALFQGAGMGALVICGLQYAPASHAAALGPGASPAWVALLGLLLFARQPTPRQVLGGSLTLAGIVALVWTGTSTWNTSILAGDAMFLAASALGATYVLRLRASGLSPFLGAAMVTVYSAAVVWPWYLYSIDGVLARVPAGELWWQILWQAFLIGAVALVAMNHAIARLGSEIASALFSLVPAFTVVLGIMVLAETPSPAEILAILVISAGVAVAALPRARQGGRPAASSAPANSLP